MDFRGNPSVKGSNFEFLSVGKLNVNLNLQMSLRHGHIRGARKRSGPSGLMPLRYFSRTLLKTKSRIIMIR